MAKGRELEARRRLKVKTAANTVELAALTARVAILEARNMTPAVITTAGAGTYTAADLAGGIIRRDPNGGSRTDTTDTAVNIIDAMELAADGDTAFCFVINTADNPETLDFLGGTDVTVTNGKVLERDEGATFLFRRTSSTTLTLDIVGS